MAMAWIWTGMVTVSLVFAAVNGTMDAVSAAALEGAGAAVELCRIIRSKKFAIKPMDVEEACVQMELLGHDFFVFRNADTFEVNVVYKRKGNTYGLIEPEF